MTNNMRLSKTRRLGLLIFLLAFVGSGLLVACGDKKKAEWEEYQKQAETRLSDLNKKVDELKTKADNATEEIKAQIKQQLEELKGKQDAANKKLQEMKAAGAEALDKLKSEMDKAFEETERLYNDLKSRLP